MDTTLANRPPIVAVVGHIDHGKSTLLDYIRKSNVALGEAGGITQHLSAYEAAHTTKEGAARTITFLDTPGHAAFRGMRARGLECADVAVLVVSAEDGVKPQTLEALTLINDVKIPFVVALTKIDKPGANVERAKMSLLEHSVLLEGLGGDVPWVAVSSKSGEGIPELLDLILLAAELEGLSADPDKQGEGLVIEARVDEKRGNTATLIVRDGSINRGEFITSGDAYAPVRIMENFLGKSIARALPGSPVRIVGFSTLPTVGARWRAVETKKEAENEAAVARAEARAAKSAASVNTQDDEEIERTIIPVAIKTDVAGAGEAVFHELQKSIEKFTAAIPPDKHVEVRIVERAVGSVGEGDVKLAGAARGIGIVAGFNVKVEREASELAAGLGVTIGTFDIIYQLTQWFEEELEKRRPRAHIEERTAYAKILKVFSSSKSGIVLGGRVEEGTLAERARVKLMRKDVELGRGEVVSMQVGKSPTKKVDGGEFGAMIKISAEPAPGDYLEAFEVVIK